MLAHSLQTNKRILVKRNELVSALIDVELFRGNCCDLVDATLLLEAESHDKNPPRSSLLLPQLMTERRVWSFSPPLACSALIFPPPTALCPSLIVPRVLVTHRFHSHACLTLLRQQNPPGQMGELKVSATLPPFRPTRQWSRPWVPSFTDCSLMGFFVLSRPLRIFPPIAMVRAKFH